MQFIDQEYVAHKLTVGRNDADVLAYLFKLFLDGLEPTPHSVTLGKALCEQIERLLDEVGSNMPDRPSMQQYKQAHEEKLTAIYSNELVRPIRSQSK